MKHLFIVLTGICSIVISMSCMNEQKSGQLTIHKSPLNKELLVDTCGIKEGDIIFQTSNSGQSKAIQLATNSIYSHVGIVLFKGSDTMVFEAVQPVKFTPISEWIDRGDNDYYEIKRYKSGLSSEQLESIKSMAKAHNQKDYDIMFEWGDNKMYCSELVFKLYYESTGDSLCQLRKLGDYDLKAAYVQDQLKRRYGIDIPLDREMISPGDLFNSEKLVSVNIGCEN